MVNEMGYDCVSFDLVLASNDGTASLSPLVQKIHLSIFEVWKLQIKEVLDMVKGDKILFAFSGPSMSSLLASCQRQDVKKVICDGGPFADIQDCMINFFKEEMGIPYKTVNFALGVLTAKLAKGQTILDNIHACLSQWSPDRPILSIRGGEDPIVPSRCIEKVFHDHKDLPIEVFDLPQGKHLDGLKNFKDSYIEVVEKFLSSSQP